MPVLTFSAVEKKGAITSFYPIGKAGAPRSRDGSKVARKSPVKVLLETIVID